MADRKLPAPDWRRCIKSLDDVILDLFNRTFFLRTMKLKKLIWKGKLWVESVWTLSCQHFISKSSI